MPSLRQDVCGRSGDDLGGSRAEDARGNRCMGIPGVPVGERTRETVGTMEGFGGKGLRAIQGHAQLMVQHAEGLSQGLRLKVGQDLDTDGVDLAWRNRIEERADVIVARDRRDAAERLRVLMSLTVVELALGLQKRRRWHAKEAKGTSGRVGSCGTGMRAAVAHVGEGSGVLTHNRLERSEA